MSKQKTVLILQGGGVLGAPTESRPAPWLKRGAGIRVVGTPVAPGSNC